MPVSRVYFWTPVFFLFFSERFAVADVLLLESLYYAGVVLLEVPSGYFSDRVGRRLTLCISSVSASLGFGLFLVAGDSLALFGLAQLARAVGHAFLSGTDTSIHYDTLAGLGRADEFEAREARFAQRGFLGSAGAAVVGGALGAFELRIPYLLSFLNALLLLALALRLHEPPHLRDAGWTGSARGFLDQVRICVGFLQSPFLLWLFAYFLFKITTEHIPYTFGQPFLLLVLGERIGDLRTTPLASGLLVATIAFVASLAAGRAVAIRERLGLGGTLLAAGVLQTALIACMALSVAAWVVPLIALRSVQAAVANPLIHAAVAPSVPQAQRATYLSMHSLIGRLGFSLVLFGLGRLAGGGEIGDPETLPGLLQAALALAVVGLLLLAVTAGALRRPPSREAGA